MQSAGSDALKPDKHGLSCKDNQCSDAGTGYFAKRHNAMHYTKNVLVVPSHIQVRLLSEQQDIHEGRDSYLSSQVQLTIRPYTPFLACQ